MKRLLLGFAALLGCCLGLWAEPAETGFFVKQNVQLAYNPLGVQLGTQLFYEVPLIKEKGVLWESTKIDLGLTNSLSPAYDFSGVFVDIEPIAIFDIALTDQVAMYYTLMNNGFHSLDSYNSSYKTTELNSKSSKNTLGNIFSIAPTIKFALDIFVFSNTFHVNYFHVDNGEGYFYEAYGNCVLAKKDFEFYNDAYALIILNPEIMVGLNDSVLYVSGSSYASQTLQAVGILKKHLSRTLVFDAALTAGIYLQDRYFQYAPRFSCLVEIRNKL